MDSLPIVFSSFFPEPIYVHSVVKNSAPFIPRITEKTVLSILRHKFTNYNDLLRDKKYDHSYLQKVVNNMILVKIEGWYVMETIGDRCPYCMSSKKRACLGGTHQCQDCANIYRLI